MMKTYLNENFEKNEPIFLTELIVDKSKSNAIRQAIKRLVAEGFLERYDVGIYYIPKKNRLLDKSFLDASSVIMRKYVMSKSEVFGYISGMAFANQLGLTTQMAATLEITTNKEATNGRVVTVGGQRVRVKKSMIEISKENAELLQYLDTINNVEKYSELSMDETKNILKEYIKQKKFTREELGKVICSLSTKTAKKLIEMGIIYEFI